jgi:NAD(P)-dependent dehydrogenase (short-subunit alcohol dehydrogenase family)
MKIENSVALVTGANRGLGRAIALELLARGAKKVYAGVRNLDAELPAGLTPIKLDVTRAEDVAAAAAAAGDVSILVNNAGIARLMGFLEAGTIDTTRELFETNFYGPVRMSQAFAPVLKRNGGGAIVNVLSVASWITPPAIAAYSASKSAAWGFTNALRIHLREQGTRALGLHVGYMDTDMTAGLDLNKMNPAQVAAQTVDGIESGAEEVLADEVTRAVKRALSDDAGVYLTEPVL